MDLYCSGYGVMELLAHRVAERAGTYQAVGVEVTLKDGADLKAMEDVASLSLGLGGAALARLTRGVGWTVVCVNTQYPLWWLVAQPSVERIEDLRGARIAGRPLASPPGLISRIVFRHHGVNLQQECSYTAIPNPQGYDEIVEGLLSRQEADAAAVRVTPFALERKGLRLLGCLGHEFSLPATGLAVNQRLIAPDDPQVLRLVDATRGALQRIHADRELAVGIIREIEPALTSRDAERLYDGYVHPHWTHDGRPDRQLAEASLRELATELGLERAPAFEDLYKAP